MSVETTDMIGPFHVIGFLSLLALFHDIRIIQQREVTLKNSLQIEAFYIELKGIPAVRFGVASAIGNVIIVIAVTIFSLFNRLFPETLFISALFIGVLFHVYANIYLVARYGKRNSQPSLSLADSVNQNPTNYFILWTLVQLFLFYCALAQYDVRLQKGTLWRKQYPTPSKGKNAWHKFAEALTQ